METPATEPIMKVLIFRAMSSSRILMRLMPAEKKADTVIPARMTVVREAPEPHARANTSNEVMSAPAKAKTGRLPMASGKRTMESMTARPAPELTPMVLGLARELFMTFCRMTPAVARPTPAPMQPKTRGRRTVAIRM